MSHYRRFDPTADRALARALDGLCAAAGLSSEHRLHLQAQAHRVEYFFAGAQIDLDGRDIQNRLIISGWAYEMRLLSDARRQIFSFLLPGDIIPARCGRPAPRSIFALTILECLELGPTPSAASQSPLVEILARALAVQADRTYDAILRLGRYTAQERLVHLLLELRERLARVGLADEIGFRSPLTQEHLADALGLSLVHVNRVLRQLRSDGVLSVGSGCVSLLQASQLTRIVHGYAPIKAQSHRL